MSPRFDPDMSKVRAGFPIYEKGEYEVALGEPKPFLYEHRDDGHIVAGVSYPLTMVGLVQTNGELDRTAEGDPVSSARLYIHTDKSFPIAKRFVMAAAGYDLDHEEEFNDEWLPDNPLWVDGEPGEEDTIEAGAGWYEVVGNHLVIDLDIELDDNNTKRQSIGLNPRPVE